MPRCWRCNRIQASAEVRRTSLGHVCKDNGPGTVCWTIVRERRAKRREAEQPTRGAEASVA